MHGVEALEHAFSHFEGYMPHGEQLHAVDRSLEYSRPLRALKLWLAFTVHGADAIRAAIERNLPVTIDIRRHGQQLFHAALPGTTAENDSWIERKVNVVNRFGAASYLVGRRLAVRGATLDEAVGVEPRLFAAHGGAFPIRIKDVGVVGSVTVSGLPQADDHAFVTEMIGAFLGV